MKLYRPSNGDEGEWFKNKFCYSCKHYKDFPEGYEDCTLGILILAESEEITSTKYPRQWIYDENNKPICTEYKDTEDMLSWIK